MLLRGPGAPASPPSADPAAVERARRYFGQDAGAGADGTVVVDAVAYIPREGEPPFVLVPECDTCGTNDVDQFPLEEWLVDGVPVLGQSRTTCRNCRFLGIGSSDAPLLLEPLTWEAVVAHGQEPAANTPPDLDSPVPSLPAPTSTAAPAAATPMPPLDLQWPEPTPAAPAPAPAPRPSPAAPAPAPRSAPTPAVPETGPATRVTERLLLAAALVLLAASTVVAATPRLALWNSPFGQVLGTLGAGTALALAAARLWRPIQRWRGHAAVPRAPRAWAAAGRQPTG